MQREILHPPGRPYGITRDGDKAIAETVDLITQTRARNPKQADALLNRVTDELSPDHQDALNRALLTAKPDDDDSDVGDTPPNDKPPAPDQPSDPNELAEPYGEDGFPDPDHPCFDAVWDTYAAYQAHDDAAADVRDAETEVARLEEAVAAAEADWRNRLADVMSPPTKKPDDRKKKGKGEKADVLIDIFGEILRDGKTGNDVEAAHITLDDLNDELAAANKALKKKRMHSTLRKKR